MNFRRLVFSLLAAGMMLPACRESNHDAPPLSSETGKSTVGGRDTRKENKITPFNGKETVLTSPEDDSEEITGDFIHDTLVSVSRTGNYSAARQNNGIFLAPLENQAEVNNMKLDNEIKYALTGRNRAIVRNQVLQSYIWPYTGVEILLDNDLFSNTDRYYTNGVKIKYRSPAMAFWRINTILPVNIKQSMEYNSLELHHGMYTPFTTKEPPLLQGDRPYAATLYIRFNRRADSPQKGLSQTASFDIGVMGEAALGSMLQKGVHAGLPSNDEPLGWETQIGNDIIINYNYILLKRLVSTESFSAYSINEASIGTLNTSAGTGIGFRTGTDSYFLTPLPDTYARFSNFSSYRWHFEFDANVTAHVVGYNATLSGGIMNRNNIYVLKPGEIERMLIRAEAGFTMRYGKYGIRLAQYYCSNEFKEGKHHFWGQAGINIGF